MDHISPDMPWVIFNLLDVHLAVSAVHVQEMVAMPKVVAVQQTPEYIRGVINLRGQVIPVMDLRMRMGMPSMHAETNSLVELLVQREQDHKNWIVELEASVHERRDFKLATDPHKCAFGKWYDRFQTENSVLSYCLAKFDEPHQIIHGIATKVKELEAQGDYDGALAVINKTKEGELAEMIKLFAEARSLLEDSVREIAMILDWEGMAMGISVDSVTAVDKLETAEVEEMPSVVLTAGNECIFGIGKWGRENELVQLMNVAKLLAAEKGLELIPTEAEVE